ncbi:nucleoprotein [Carpione rhabdovirus]|nr:nucleoprotein [Carpione rhabdovirus]
MSMRDTFEGLKDVKVDTNGGDALDFDPSKVELVVYLGDAPERLDIVVKAVSAIGGAKTREALAILMAFLTIGEEDKEYKERIQVLADIGFKVKPTMVEKDIDPGMDIPLEKVAAQITEENVREVVRAVLYTCALFVKYNVDKMAKYIQNKLQNLAVQQGVPELTEFPTDKGTLRKIASFIRPGQRTTNALYAFLVIEMSDPATQQNARAMGAMRINGTGMTMIGLFTQAAKSLGATPADLLADLCMKSLVESAKRIVRLMVQVSKAASIQERYAIMMCRMLNENYFKAYGLTDNSRISCILAAVNSKFNSDTVDNLEGIHVSPAFQLLADEIASALVEKYDGSGGDEEEVSDIVRAAARHLKGVFSRRPAGANSGGRCTPEEDDQEDDSKDSSDFSSFFD